MGNPKRHNEDTGAWKWQLLHRLLRDRGERERDVSGSVVHAWSVGANILGDLSCSRSHKLLCDLVDEEADFDHSVWMRVGEDMHKAMEYWRDEHWDAVAHILDADQDMKDVLSVRMSEFAEALRTIHETADLIAEKLAEASKGKRHLPDALRTVVTRDR
ncbi:MAG: hypothetical protein ACRDYX_21150 [Egibacteraceae bacterium]